MALHESYNAAEVIGVQWATIWFPKAGNFAPPQSLANFDPQKPETYPRSLGTHRPDLGRVPAEAHH